DVALEESGLGAREERPRVLRRELGGARELAPRLDGALRAEEELAQAARCLRVVRLLALERSELLEAERAVLEPRRLGERQPGVAALLVADGARRLSVAGEKQRAREEEPRAPPIRLRGEASTRRLDRALEVVEVEEELGEALVGRGPVGGGEDARRALGGAEARLGGRERELEVFCDARGAAPSGPPRSPPRGLRPLALPRAPRRALEGARDPVAEGGEVRFAHA